MKNYLRETIYGKNARASAFFVIGILIFAGLGCFGIGKKTDSKPTPPAYIGEWKGQDGSTVSIRADGKGDYHSGSTKVDGGTVEVNEADKKLSITFFGIGPTLKIDSAPTGDEMKLDGVTYRRSGGFATTTDTKKPVTDASNTADTTTASDTPVKFAGKKADASKGEMPSDDEMQQIVRTTLLDFNDAIKQGDFTDFHGKISKTWQKQTTPETFNSAFSEFITKKLDISEVSSLDAEFSPAPTIDRSQGVKMLLVKGKYDTTPLPAKFDLKYIPDGKEWKLFAIQIDTRDY